jgi:uroporphyrinogen-III synthase
VKTVWVTRTLPGAEATAERVRAAGFEAFVAPLLEVEFEPGGEIDLADVTSVAFTSANGVRAFAARSAARDLPVFAVGKGTAKAARDAAFADVTASNGDVLALAEAIPPGGVVLHAGAAEPAADLVLALGGRGIAARGLVVYRTVPATLSEADLATTAGADFVLLQSAKAARAFRDLGLDGPRPICLSSAIAILLEETTVAAAPTEDALIAALIDAAR